MFFCGRLKIEIRTLDLSGLKIPMYGYYFYPSPLANLRIKPPCLWERRSHLSKSRSDLKQNQRYTSKSITVQFLMTIDTGISSGNTQSLRTILKTANHLSFRWYLKLPSVVLEKTCNNTDHTLREMGMVRVRKWFLSPVPFFLEDIWTNRKMWEKGGIFP